MHAIKILVTSLSVTIVLGLLLLSPATGLAEGAAQRVVLAPLSSLSGRSSKGLARVEAIIEAGLRSVPGVVLVPASEAAAASRKAKRPELRSCDGDERCLSELGALLSANYSVYAEVGGLGTSQVVYLKLVEVASAKEARSTTLELAGDEDRTKASLAAATRLLAPNRYVGYLELRASMPDATAFLDGHQIDINPSAVHEIFVGSHALRVTHPERSDYVRWVDIGFQEKVTVEAKLQALPDLRQKLSLSGTIANADDASQINYHPTPWYLRWYTIGGGAAAIFVGSAILFATFTDDINADATKAL